MCDSGPQSQRKSFRACSSFLHVLNLPSLSLWMGTLVLSWGRRSSTGKLSTRNFQRTGENASTASSYQQPNSPKSRNSRLGGGISRLGLLSDLHWKSWTCMCMTWGPACLISRARAECVPHAGFVKAGKTGSAFPRDIQQEYLFCEGSLQVSYCKQSHLISQEIVQQLLPDGEHGSRGFLGKQK